MDYKPLLAISSKGGFEEFHDKDDIVEIGSVYFNTKTNKIVRFIEEKQDTVTTNEEVVSATAAMSIDPLCEKYYWISPYAYCLNNPLKFIDPNGLDVYTLDEKGYIKLHEKTKDKSDQLIALGEAGEITYDKEGNMTNSSLAISDQSILPGLTESRFDFKGHYAATSNKDDAFGVFKFAADNSKVEWGLTGYKGGNYLIKTSHNEKFVKSSRGDFIFVGLKDADLVFLMHSHPGGKIRRRHQATMMVKNILGIWRILP